MSDYERLILILAFVENQATDLLKEYEKLESPTNEQTTLKMIAHARLEEVTRILLMVKGLMK